MKKIVKLIQNEWIRQCTKKTFVILVAIVLVLSALVPILSQSIVPIDFDYDQKIETNVRYEKFLKEMDELDTSQCTDVQLQMIELYEKYSLQQYDWYMKNNIPPFSILNFRLSFDASDEVRYHQAHEILLAQQLYKLNLKNMEQLTQTIALPHLFFYDLNEYLSAFSDNAKAESLVQQAEKIIGSPLDCKQILIHDQEYLQQQLDTLETGRELYLNQSDGESEYEWDLNIIDKGIQLISPEVNENKWILDHEAYNPYNWKYGLYRYNIRRVEIAGYHDQTSHQYIGHEKDYCENLYALEHNIPPIDVVSRTENTRQQLMYFLPVLLIAAFVSAIVSAWVIGDDFKKKKTILLDEPLTSSKMVTAKLLACISITLGIVLASVLINLITTVILYGAGDLANGVASMRGSQVVLVPFLDFYARHIAQMFCVALFSMSLSFCLSMRFKNRCAGICINGLLFLGFLAKYIFDHIGYMHPVHPFSTCIYNMYRSLLQSQITQNLGVSTVVFLVFSLCLISTSYCLCRRNKILYNV